MKKLLISLSLLAIFSCNNNDKRGKFKENDTAIAPADILGYDTGRKWMVITYAENETLTDQGDTFLTRHYGKFVDSLVARGWPKNRIETITPKTK